jgi:hypothetical protein
MAKTMANKNPSEESKNAKDEPRLVLAELAWTPLDRETTAGQHGLTPLLLHRFGHEISEPPHRTVAQVLVDRLLERAMDGHHQSLEEIMTRIDGDAKSSGPAVQSARNGIELDQPAAQRVLDAMLEPGDEPPDH